LIKGKMALWGDIMLKNDNKWVNTYINNYKLFPLVIFITYVLISLFWITFLQDFLVKLAHNYHILTLDRFIISWIPVIITSSFIYTIFKKLTIEIKGALPVEYDDCDNYFSEVRAEKKEQQYAEINAEMCLDSDFGNGIIDNAPIFVILLDLKGNLLKFNRFSEDITGFQEKEVLGLKWTSILMDEENKLGFMKMISHAKKENNPIKHECKILCKDEREIYSLWNSVRMNNKEGILQGVICIGVDISEQKEAEKKLLNSYQEIEAVYEELAATEEELQEKFQELQHKEQDLHISEERYRLALEGSRDAIWDWDIKINKAFISERWRQMLGYEEEDLRVNQLTWKELIHPDDKERAFKAQQDHLSGKTDFYSSEYRLKMKNGEYKWIMVRGKALRDSEGNPIRIAGSQTDISERKYFEEKINFMAYYDSLTGLPNRVSFEKNLKGSLQESTIRNLRGAVLFLDLDNFKTVNDTFGHVAGDELLKNVADLLKGFETKNIKIARFGGDEFTIMVHDIKDDDFVRNLATSIVKTLNRSWSIKDKKFYNSVSIGVVFYPDKGCDVQTVLSSADCAMYSVKKSGKDNYGIYSSKMNDKLLERINIESNLRQALVNEEFTIHYQPLVNQKTGEFTGTEALIRWNHPSLGIISPGDFIPIAEETGLIVPIGEWVLREACKQTRRWQDIGYHDFDISVNISANQLKHPNIVEKIKTILDETGLKAKNLCLEVTENIAISDIDFAVKVLERLQSIGVSIALDDFGTGYSSLSYLRRLPINIIKVDRSFVKELGKNTHANAITEAIISMAHNMNVKVIAEGIEMCMQNEFLKHKGCDMAQGYLFSRPLPSDEMEKLMNQKLKRI
jgi:diguanylate cyclase (GGDEF)-like protein/PAS domain S-box-containing protein